MNSFLDKIEKTYKNNNEVKTFIELYKIVKYKEPFTAILILHILEEQYENKFEIYFHLFNHYLFLKLLDEAENYLKKIIEEKEFLKDILLDYKIMIKNNEEFEKFLLSENYENINNYLEMNFRKIENINISKNYYELAETIKNIYFNIAEKYYKKSIENSTGKWRIKIILNYSNILIKNNKKEEAKELLFDFSNKMEENESIPILYKLASIFEKSDVSKAVSLFRRVYNIDKNYLDIEEKLNKLTKHQKGCKINNYENNNIHFY